MTEPAPKKKPRCAICRNGFERTSNAQIYCPSCKKTVPHAKGAGLGVKTRTKSGGRYDQATNEELLKMQAADLDKLKTQKAKDRRRGLIDSAKNYANRAGIPESEALEMISRVERKRYSKRFEAVG